MVQNMIQSSIAITTVFLITSVLLLSPAFAQNISERDKLFAEAHGSFLNGSYKEAIEVFDEILEMSPTYSKALEMKGISYSNMRLESTLASQPQQNASLRDPSNLNKLSMLEFYKVLEINPNSVLALNGMGLGFGNFGEYSEAETYFKKSLKIDPDNPITQNYLKSLEKLKKKYSLTVFENPTKKPDFLLNLEKNTVPIWVKNNAGWWSEGKISDDDFISGIEYLIENNIIEVNAEMDYQLTENELERKAWNFERYIINIQNDIKKQNRYVENINPSEYVIIKYWKDYHKWNLEQFLSKPEVFPDRNVFLDPESDKYVIEYKIYINEQPLGLPIDHVSTLENSFKFWEKYEFSANDGKKAMIRFDTTDQRTEANVWVTWVVRSLGEGVLGHANFGKGVVEVAIGSYGCDGSFQLFDADTVEYIMTHELGHSIGLKHSTNQESIMYPTIPYAGYEYCLLR